MLSVGSLPGVIAWRNQVGVYETGHGWVTYGLGVGSPDIVCSVKGRLVGLEVKSDTGGLSDKQRATHSIWRAFGIVVGVVRSAKEAKGLVAHVLAYADETDRKASRSSVLDAMAISAPYRE